jgi:peptidoglycan-associated lipoprotein
VNYSKRKWTLLVLALAAIVVIGGCKKKQAPAAPPEAAAPASPKPEATLSVSPDTVTAPTAAPVEAPPHAEAPSPTEADLFQQNVKDIYFDYDKYDLRSGDQAIVAADAAFLSAHPSMKFTIEGHCDERGSTDYNLALGDNRANSARDALIKAGVHADQIKTISYGKEKPFCAEHSEECWQQNRRDHLVYGR